jgi:hypothetical protein
VAAAAASTPSAADAGVTKASDNVGVELPASRDSHPSADAGHDDGTDDTAADDATSEVDDQSGAPEDNHGAEVSAVAHSDFETGREHGEAVSAVARGDHGTQATGDESDDESLEADDADEIEHDSTDVDHQDAEHEDGSAAAGARAHS